MKDTGGGGLSRGGGRVRREGGEGVTVMMVVGVDGGGLDGRRGRGVTEGGVIVYVCFGVRRPLWTFLRLRQPCEARRCVELWSGFYLRGFSQSVL